MNKYEFEILEELECEAKTTSDILNSFIPKYGPRILDPGYHKALQRLQSLDYIREYSVEKKLHVTLAGFLAIEAQQDRNRELKHYWLSFVLSSVALLLSLVSLLLR